MKILAVSDTEVSFIYSPVIADRFRDTDLIISCGDLPYFYIEYIISMLNKPAFFVKGNHANTVEIGAGEERRYPWGAIDLHTRTINQAGVLLAGIEGCLRYNYGTGQYTQNEMWAFARQLALKLMINRIRFGRYLDIFISHAPPWKIHDGDDRAHQGIKAFNWLLKVFQPRYHLHGHTHIYHSGAAPKTVLGKTCIINVYGYQFIDC
jgi:Icc-related predicted phosphoesterase